MSFWTLNCHSFDLRLLIIPLVSSSFSCVSLYNLPVIKISISFFNIWYIIWQTTKAWVRVADLFSFLCCAVWLCLVCLRPFVRVSSVASVSGLSILDCPFSFLYQLFNFNWSKTKHLLLPVHVVLRMIFKETKLVRD